jgi:steroid delta-isomerase
MSPQRLPDDPRMRRVVAFYEGLQPADLARLDTVYTADARFRDPFHDVQGLPALRAIFERMFRDLASPRFELLDGVVAGDRGFLTWNFHARLRGRAVRIHGGSWLEFAPEGRVAVHRDYWDAAQELYEQLPLIGSLMRWLRRRAAS